MSSFKVQCLISDESSTNVKVTVYPQDKSVDIENKSLINAPILRFSIDDIDFLIEQLNEAKRLIRENYKGN